MAIWYDLPAEVKQNILAYLLDGLPAKFEPRHAATRSTSSAIARQCKNEDGPDNSDTDSVASMLLVSKNFVTYNEIEGALLSNAKIVLSNYRSLNTLEMRYGKDGLAMIKEIMLDAGETRRGIQESKTKYPYLYPYLKTKMFNTQRVVVSMVGRFQACFRPYLTHDEAVIIAQGGPLVASDLSSRGQHWSPFHGANDATAVARTILQGILDEFLWYISRKRDGWLIQLLDVEICKNCEIVIEWQTAFAVFSRGGYGLQPKNVQFSSKNMCVALKKAGEIFLCPQRLDEQHLHGYGDWPWLFDSVNAIEHDKYYTI